MITIIIFLVSVVGIYALNLLVFMDSMSIADISLVYAIALVGIIAINAIVAIVCAKLIPDKAYLKDNKLFTSSKKECKFYERIGIKKWKDRILELGKLNNFRKNKIDSPNDPEYVKKFIAENNKGFMTHFVSIILGIPFIFLLPIKFWLPMTLPLCIASFILNVMPLFILRYNMPRLKVLLKFSERSSKRKELDVDTKSK